MKEEAISARKEAQIGGLRMKAHEEISTSGQTKYGGVTFDRRKGPSPVLKTRLADWLIELANRGFDLSTGAILKSVKKFLDKE